MAQGDRVISSRIVAGTFFEQEGTVFSETEAGEFDVGQRSYVTHPSSSRDNAPNYPRVGDRDIDHPFMQIFHVDDLNEESGVRFITCYYRGVLNTNSGDSTKSNKIIRSTSTQIVNLPAMTGGGDSQPRTLIVPIPMPVITRSFITTNNDYQSDPHLGVGNPAPPSAASFLPPPGSWNISYLPDPDHIPPANYYIGWILMDRVVEDAAKGLGLPARAWGVQETYQFFWGFNV